MTAKSARAGQAKARLARVGGAMLAALALAAPAMATTFIAPGTLLISSTTYFDTGVVSMLVAGS